MKRYSFLFLFLSISVLFSCSTSDNVTQPTDPVDPIDTSLYFPPLTGSTWESTSPSDLNWNETNLEDLYTYLEERNTKGFMILKDGKIVVERYFNGHNANASWRWFSAVKSLTATAVGIAQDENYLNINNKTSDYLGNNWSSLTTDKQDLISVENHLSMTTGLQNTPANFIAWTCTAPLCMVYNFDAGTSWQYHQGAFTQLQRMLSQNTGQNFKAYIKEKISDKIGMSGSWEALLDVNIFSTNTRDMARFGLLSLNKGSWDDQEIVSESYFNAMTNTSQNINKAYGYLWWLNGKESFVGTDSVEISGSLIPNGPDDMFCALGAQDQKIYVIPSKNMVVIRSGETAGVEVLANSSFDNELWGKINLVID